MVLLAWWLDLLGKQQKLDQDLKEVKNNYYYIDDYSMFMDYLTNNTARQELWTQFSQCQIVVVKLRVFGLSSVFVLWNKSHIRFYVLNNVSRTQKAWLTTFGDLVNADVFSDCHVSQHGKNDKTSIDGCATVDDGNENGVPENMLHFLKNQLRGFILFACLISSANYIYFGRGVSGG